MYHIIEILLQLCAPLQDFGSPQPPYYPATRLGWPLIFNGRNGYLVAAIGDGAPESDQVRDAHSHIAWVTRVWGTKHESKPPVHPLDSSFPSNFQIPLAWRCKTLRSLRFTYSLKSSTNPVSSGSNLFKSKLLFILYLKVEISSKKK